VSRTRSAADQIWPRVALVAVILILWGLVYAAGVFDPKLFPSPLSVWHAFTTHLAGENGLLLAAGRSIIRLAVGMAAAVVIGTAIGLAMASWKPIQRSFGTLMVALQALPSIAWLSLALLWLGQRSARAIVWIVIIGAFPSVAIATATSVRLVPPVLIRAGRTLGATGWELQKNVIFPAAIPGYFAGLQQAWAFAWRALLAGELIATGARGLGQTLAEAGAQSDTSLVLATMAIIAAVGLFIDLGLSVFDRRLRRRRGLVTAP
jgi:NitT/TauT family transport system permease protein